MKKCKQNFFTKFFENNLKNLKNTWSGIKNVRLMKRCSPYSTALVAYQSETIENPERISNIFNNYVSAIREKTQEKIKHSHNNYSDHLTYENPDSFFLSPTDKEKLNLLSPPLISTNRLLHIVFLIWFLKCLKMIFLNSLLSYLIFLLAQALSQLF